MFLSFKWKDKNINSKSRIRSTKRFETHNLSYFLGRNVFGGDGFQYIFVYQPTHTFKVKKENITDYVFRNYVFMYLSYFFRNFTLKNYLFGATSIVKSGCIVVMA